jgi:hypothetical protein
LDWVNAAALNEFTTKANKLAAGRKVFSISSRFGPSIVPNPVTPVILPPGRFKLATSPKATGSTPTKKTIGMVLLAAFAASAVGTPFIAAMTATLRATNSAANQGKLSYCASAQPY